MRISLIQKKKKQIKTHKQGDGQVQIVITDTKIQ